MLSQNYSRYVFAGLLALVPLASWLGWSSREVWGTLLLSGTAFCLLLLDVAGGWRQPRPKFPLLLLLFAALITVSTITSTYRYTSLLVLLQVFAGLTVFALAQRHLTSLTRQKWLGVAFIAVLAGTAGYAIAQVPTLGNLELGVGATFVWKNALAGFIVLVVPIVLAQLAIAKHWWWKLLLSITCAASAVALFFTAAQAGWVIFSLGSALMVALNVSRQTNRGPLLRWLTLSLMLSVAATAWLMLVARGFEATQTTTPTTFSRLTATALPESSSTRINYWMTSLEIIRDFPLFGVGPGNFSTWYTHYFKQPWLYTISPHSYLVYLLVTTGMIATATFVVFILATLWSIFHWARGGLRSSATNNLTILQLGWIVGSMSLLLHSLVDISLEVPAISLLWWMVLGVLSANLSPNATSSASQPLKNFGALGLASGLIGLTMVMLFADNFYQQAIKLQNTMGKSPTRISLLKKSQRLMPLSANTAEALSNAYWDAVLDHAGRREDNLQAMLNAAQTAERLDPASAHRQWILGKAYYMAQTSQQNYWPQVIAHLAQAIAYDFHDPTYYQTLAEAYLRLGWSEQARQTIQTALALYPPEEVGKIFAGGVIYEQLGLKEKLDRLRQLRQTIGDTPQ